VRVGALRLIVRSIDKEKTNSIDKRLNFESEQLLEIGNISYLVARRLAEFYAFIISIEILFISSRVICLYRVFRIASVLSALDCSRHSVIFCFISLIELRKFAYTEYGIMMIRLHVLCKLFISKCRVDIVVSLIRYRWAFK
jgi:hypothetical protein